MGVWKLKERMAEISTVLSIQLQHVRLPCAKLALLD